MFLDFFLLLKNDGLPVTFKEYLTLLEALDRDVVAYNVDDFYYLSRSTLVKHEQFLDRFDRIFGRYFRDIETIDAEEFFKIPEEWLRKSMQNALTDEEKEMIKALGGLDKLLDRLRVLMREQKRKHEGGNKWIGTGGTSPFGAYGYNPEGIRIGQDESRNRRAVKVWDRREFRNLDDSVELDTRNMKMALRRLRVLTREGVDEEVDLDETIRKTSKSAGMLELEMIPAKKNNVKVLLFLDVGGSMDDHIEICARLFSAAKYEFKHLEYFYFHNCIYEKVWKDNARRWDESIPTFEVLHKYNSDYKVIVVGDASMSPYELLYQNGSVEHNNDEPGFVWLERLKNQYPDIVWLNPVPEEDWIYVETVQMLKKFMDDRMFPLTLSGISRAIKALKNRKLKSEGN
ncbi:MAG TPA: VWA domain-containing protein [Thermodesulfobacteriota bacterium]|nr:VWA domain-containing protein [Thermodesulfobacteriota bacterium]